MDGTVLTRSLSKESDWSFVIFHGQPSGNHHHQGDSVEKCYHYIFCNTMRYLMLQVHITKAAHNLPVRTRYQGSFVCILGKIMVDIDGLMQNCSNSSASALELLQSCTKPSLSLYIYTYIYRLPSTAASPLASVAIHWGNHTTRPLSFGPYRSLV